jgi:hypothetical protein
MKIKVCTPHYFTSTPKGDFDLPGGWIPGSARGDHNKRRTSFSKCLWSLIHAGKSQDYYLLDIRTNQFNRVRKPKHHQHLDVTVVTDGENFCEDVLAQYRDFVEVKHVDVEDSKNLIFEAREYLLQQEGYDLYLYCEDDIGFTTKDYFAKIKWFAEATDNKAVLMPHRFENPYSPDIEKLYIDGPIDQNLLRKFMEPQIDALRLDYNGREIVFNKPMNPHSATFCITENQRKYINEQGIERRGDFVSTFESVCTLSVLEFFDVYKTDFKFREFLEVEQHYTNYC